MSAIRKLIEMARAESLGPTDDAEAELNRLIEVQNRDADKKLSLQTQLAERDAAYRAKCLEVSELIGEAIERDRADAELLAAWREWEVTPGDVPSEPDYTLHTAVERWAAAKGDSQDYDAEGRTISWKGLALEYKAQLATQPRIDLEALRKALREAAENAQLPPHFQWSESNREKFRFGAETAAAAVDDAFLAQLEGAKGQPCTCDVGQDCDVCCPRPVPVAVPISAPKPEAQTCGGCAGRGGEHSATGVSTCQQCNGTGKVGGGK